MKHVLYTAAHSGFDLGAVPLGGGAQVCRHLVKEWTRARPFEWQLLGPEVLGETGPRNKELVQYSELDYARFCRRFERKTTETILAQDPTRVVVLSNDVSEGPDFKFLALKGYSIYTIYHVDVVDYFTAIYLRSCVKPERTTAFYRSLRSWGLSRFVPDVLNLVWKKQEDSVRYSKGLLVPSERMKEVLVRCYPEADPSRIHVLPWGAWQDDICAPTEIQQEKEALRAQFPIPVGALTLLTLSRISPEKGQDRLLKALALWEKQPDFPKEGICLFIAGEAAYMMGKKYEKTLKSLAGRLKRCRVYFVGYAAGARKKALFSLSEIYIFPSRHESYGLTLLEALQEGRPVLTTPTYGAKEVFQPAFGEMISSGPDKLVPQRLLEGLKRLRANRSRWPGMGQAGADWAAHQNFSHTAEKLARLLNV